MPQVLPWYCPHTDRLFGSKALYVEHLKAMARDRYDLRMRRLRSQWARQFLLENIKKVSSIEGLRDFIIENSYAFYLNGMGRDKSGYLDRNPAYRASVSKTYEFTRLEFRLSFSDGSVRIPECHSSPGLFGRLIFHYSYDVGCEKPMNPFADLGILTGSGGGRDAGDGEGSMWYEVYLRQDDWPNLMIGEKLLAD